MSFLEKLFSKKVPPGPGAIKPLVLLILDGWGIAPPSAGNAIDLANTPNMDRLLQIYPHTELSASGESVGLPSNEVGNTEVGHLTIGAGRVVPQSLKRIITSIEDNSFFENRAFRAAYDHVVKNNSKLHLMGLVGTGNVHASVDHLYKLLEYYRRLRTPNVYLHLFTDGRDSPPKEGQEVVGKIEEHLKSIKMGRVATVMGRYWAMDRDRRWDRTKRAYEALVLARGSVVASGVAALQAAYAKGQTDEFVEPTIIPGADGQPVTISDNDAVVFFNFRIDRPRQLTMAFVMPDFENPKDFSLGYEPDQGRVKTETLSGKTFTREKKLNNLFFVTMTEYQKNLPVSAVAFPPPVIESPLSEVLSQHNLTHMHMAESEKERMVTFYFNGLRDTKFAGEATQIIASPKVATYDLRPQMSVIPLAEAVIRNIERSQYHFLVINFANPDMVAHTGNLQAAIKACEAADKAVGMVASKVLEYDGTLLITGDHGNAEDLLTYPTGTFYYTTAKGEMNTDHSNNPVPLLFINKKYENQKLPLAKGALSDVAATILNLLGIPKPAVMTGKSVILANSPQPGVS